MDTSKALIVFVLIYLYLIYILVMKEINLKMIILIGFIGIMGLFIMYYYFFRLEFVPFNILFSIFHRLFIGQVIPFYWWQSYQETYGFLQGLSFPNPRGIFPFEHINISVEVMSFIHPELAKKGIVGSMPTVFYADWWINFGVFGALFSMLLLGFIMQMFEQTILKFLKYNYSYIMHALYFFVIIHFSQYALTSFVGIIVDIKFVVPILIVVMYIKIFEDKGKNEKSNIHSFK